VTPELAVTPHANEAGVAVLLAMGIRAGSCLRRNAVPVSFLEICLGGVKKDRQPVSHWSMAPVDRAGLTFPEAFGFDKSSRG
jgi:hypothetical protein